MRLCAYTRVSTIEQKEHGAGLQIQEQALRTWAKENGHRITLRASDEGVSGSNGLDKREGLLRALSALQAGEVGGIVVYRLDRLARDLVVQESLLAEVWRAGGRLYSTSSSEDSFLDPEGAEADPSRALVRQLLGAVSEYERAMIRLRLKAGRVRKKEQGGYAGGSPPLGTRAEGGSLVACEDEAETVARICELRREGNSLRQIVTVLDAEQRPTKRGGQWHSHTVGLIVKRAGL